jgi:arsenate reductase
MAEAIARKMGYNACSAGTNPSQKVNAKALKVLESKNYSTDGLYPKSIDDVDWKSYNKIISMGCGVSCPAIKIDIDWKLDDPVSQPIRVFEEIALIIEQKIKEL